MRGRSKVPWWLVTAVVAGVMLAAPLFGYTLMKDESGSYVVKWQSSPVTMQVKLSATANLLDGRSQVSSVVAAMEAWNAQLGTVRLTGVAASPGPYATGNEVNEIVIDDTVDGEAFPEGTLAITMNYRQSPNDFAEADIVFNRAYTWNSYRGSVRAGVEDIHRVAIHEIGHVLGLDHPDEHGQHVTAIMNSRRSAIDQLQADDIQGGQQLYGPPGFVPENDAFANATLVNMPVNVFDQANEWMSGSNIAARREPGEPNHAGTPHGHSVWWKWTAPRNGEAVLSTLGSDFDTVLAVYTGPTVSSLTEIASNDDEEMPEQNPTPQRKRTSKVAFEVSGGTTYFIAADGWADDDGSFHGYTGSISLHVFFRVKTPPAVYAEPEDQIVEAGQTADFVTLVSGQPHPSFRWERLQKGANTWKEVVEGGPYSLSTNGMDGATLRITASLGMDGDQFRCVATNESGTATTRAARLRVTPTPVPIITTQPAGGNLYTDIKGGLYVEATGATSYQWYHNGVALMGKTASELVFLNPQPADAGEYYVIVANGGGSVKSAVVTIAVIELPIVTNTNSTRQVAGLGNRFSLQVSATGRGPLRYQWYHDGWPIEGATESIYGRSAMTAADAGAYWAAVTDSVGTRHGAPFFVLVDRGLTNVVGWGTGIATGVLQPPDNLTTAIAVTGGLQSAYALKRNGEVQGWGYLGLTAATIAEWRDVVAIASAPHEMIALRADGSVVGTGRLAEVPSGLKSVTAIACGTNFAAALKTDGTVVSWPEPAPADLRDVVAIAGGGHALALKRDGKVVAWGPSVAMLPPDDLSNVVALAGGMYHALALSDDGSVVGWDNWYLTAPPADVPPEAKQGVKAIAAGAYHSLALKEDGTVVVWGDDIDERLTLPPGLGSVFAIGASSDSSFALRDISRGQPVLITQPVRHGNADIDAGHGVMFSVAAASGTTAPVTYRWEHNGRVIAGATGPSLTLLNVQPEAAGIYTASATDGSSVAQSSAVLGLTTYGKAAGAGRELAFDILHPNGNVFDQVLLEGAAGVVRADEGQITRTSFIDVDGDIVQVEFSGSGTLSVVLDSPSGPALPENYSQDVRYMKGHAGLVIIGADETTNVSVFSVGRATAFDPTGGFNFLAEISPSNQPMNNRNPIFSGHGSTSYDGVADIAFIAIVSSDGKFGSVRTANANYFASQGFTGIYAPRVAFQGPVYIGDISAFDDATSVIQVGSASDVRITGGDLLQDNGAAVEVSGIAQLKFTSGSDSHGRTLPAQANKAKLISAGVDVTAEIVANPKP